MSCNSKNLKFPLTIDELKEINFPKVFAKVSGFLIAKTIDRYTERETDYIKVRLSRKKNTIVGIPNLINAFQTYMGNTAYTGSTVPQAGIILTTTQGTQVPLSFAYPPVITANSGGATLMFVAYDNSTNSYTVSSEQLNTQSIGKYIKLATNSVPITKQSSEILSVTWLVNIDVSISGQLQYIPTSYPQQGGVSCSASGDCGCVSTSARSQFPNGLYNCSAVGLTNENQNTSFVTTQLFTDMFYNSYSQGGDSIFIATTSNTIYIYSLYCTTYFFAGIANSSGNYVTSGTILNGSACADYTSQTSVNPIYLQLYYPQQPANYIGVQVVYGT